MSQAAEIALRIERDGLHPECVHEATFPGGFAETPADCSVTGCGWPERYTLTLPESWKSGVYRITLSAQGVASQHMFVLRAAQPTARIAMVLATGTWCAYNDWGGSNHYQGLTGPEGQTFAADVSIHRPWAKGFVEWPSDAPRIPHSSPPNQRPSYPHMIYARSKGISKKYASSGWAAFERPFALWCEAQGIALDYLTQHDLHANPAALNAYPRALIVGHDEYWTWEMRDHLETWVDQGGQLCRFAGNFYWQTRLSADLATQTCYKTRAGAEDPTPDRSRHDRPLGPPRHPPPRHADHGPDRIGRRLCRVEPLRRPWCRGLYHLPPPPLGAKGLWHGLWRRAGSRRPDLCL